MPIARSENFHNALLWLLRFSQLERVNVDQSPVAAIRAASRQIPLRGGITLADILFCHERAWSEGWLESAFELCKQHDLSPQALLICPVFQATHTPKQVCIRQGGAMTQVDGRLDCVGEMWTGFPMLMLARITTAPGKEAPVITDALLQPIYSSHLWVPMYSDGERDALRTILAAKVALKRIGVSTDVDRVIRTGEEQRSADITIRATTSRKARVLEIVTLDAAQPILAKKKLVIAQELQAAGRHVFIDTRNGADSMANGRIFRYVMGAMLGREKTG